MSVERVRAHLAKWNLADRVMEFEVSSATVALAAQAVGCPPAQIVKTLSFRAPEADGCLLVACAGDARIDNSKFKQVFGVKAAMLSPEQAVELTGHAVGGVCPFAVKMGARVCLDRSIARFDWVFPAAGSASSAARLTPEELEMTTGGAWVDVCKDWAGA